MMTPTLRLSLLVALSLLTTRLSAASYGASVVHHIALGSITNASDALHANLAAVVADIGTAARRDASSIVVLPEFGLLPVDFTKSCTSTADAHPVLCPSWPSAGAEPSDAWPAAAAALSAAAAQYKIFVAVNVCDRHDGANYNTEVVFSPSGRVAAKYDKSHPYNIKCFAKPAVFEDVVVNASSVSPNLQWGVFTCLDILYAEPSSTLLKRGVRHFIYSSAIPVIGGDEKRKWSKKHDAVLLGSDSAPGESGIFVRGEAVTPKGGLDEKERVISASVDFP